MRTHRTALRSPDCKVSACASVMLYDVDCEACAAVPGALGAALEFVCHGRGALWAASPALTRTGLCGVPDLTVALPTHMSEAGRHDDELLLSAFLVGVVPSADLHLGDPVCLPATGTASGVCGRAGERAAHATRHKHRTRARMMRIMLNASKDAQVWVYNPLARLTGARRSRSTGRSWWLTSGRGARALQAAERSGAPPAAPGPLLLQGLPSQACPPQWPRAGACDSILCDTALALQICLRAPLHGYPPQAGDGPLRHS